MMWIYSRGGVQNVKGTYRKELIKKLRNKLDNNIKIVFITMRINMSFNGSILTAGFIQHGIG
jgi:hypothetical protein